MYKESVNLDNVVVCFEINGEWVDVGTVNNVEVKIDDNKIEKLNLLNRFGGLSGTLHNVEINYMNPIIRKQVLEVELNHLLQVIKYAKHSKKLDKAYKRYEKLYEEYLDI